GVVVGSGRRVVACRCVFGGVGVFGGAQESGDFPCGQSGEFARAGLVVAQVDQVTECGTDSGVDLVAFVEPVEHGGYGLFALLLGLLVPLVSFAGALASGQSLRRLGTHAIDTRACLRCPAMPDVRLATFCPRPCSLPMLPILSAGVLQHLPMKSHTQY